MAIIPIDKTGGRPDTSGRAPAEDESSMLRPSRQPSKPLLSAMALLAAGFAIQLVTPLRLQTDSIVLHRMAASLVDHGDAYADGPAFFWPGLPFLLACLESAGIACSAGFVALNLSCIAIGLTAAWHIISDDDSPTMAWYCVLACLGSWLFIKHSTIALTDLPCMAMTMLSLHYYTRAAHWRSARAWFDVASGVLCTIAACAIRPNAVALLAALTTVLVSMPRVRALVARAATNRRVAWTAAAASAVVVFAGFFLLPSILRQTAYGRDLLGRFAGGGNVAAYLLSTLGYRSNDAFTTFFNLPNRAIPHQLDMGIGVLGAVLFLWAIGVTLARLPKQRASDAFLFAFLGILAIWPYGDPRFFIPALPLVFRSWFTLLAACPRPARLGYVALFALGSIASMAYSTSVSLSGASFTDIYSTELRNSYRRALEIDPVVGNSPANAEVVRILGRYGDRRVTRHSIPSPATSQ